jgi:hypothetical protein
VLTGKVSVVSAHLRGTNAKVVSSLLSIRAVEIKPSYVGFSEPFHIEPTMEYIHGKLAKDHCFPIYI